LPAASASSWTKAVPMKAATTRRPGVPHAQAHCYDKLAYKGGNVVERCFCRLKDFRCIGTRYDKLARNFFSALCLVWL
jgi:transposase